MYRTVIQLNGTGIFHHTIFRVSYLIHVLAADGTDLLQEIDHAVYGCNSQLVILFQCPVEDFLTAGAFILEDNINQPKSLLRNTAAFFFQLGQYDLSLHFRGLIAYLFLSVHNDLHSGCSHRHTEWIFHSFCLLSFCGQSMRLHRPVSPIQLRFP